MYNYRDIDENKIFRNGGLNLHIARITHRRQSGIIQIFKENTSDVYKQQKNFVWTVLQSSPKIWGLATGLIWQFIWVVSFPRRVCSVSVVAI